MTNDNDPTDRFTERTFAVWEESRTKDRMCMEGGAQPWLGGRVLKRIVVRFDNYGSDHTVTEVLPMKPRTR